MPNIGTTELLILLGIVVLIFGASRLPELGSNLGRSIRGFRHAVADDSELPEQPRAEANPEEIVSGGMDA